MAKGIIMLILPIKLDACSRLQKDKKNGCYKRPVNATDDSSAVCNDIDLPSYVIINNI